jgi:hypothetical protein
MRADRIKCQGEHVSNIFLDYEELKKRHQQTDEQCIRQGFAFEPLIIEAHGGGWSPTLRKVVDNIAVRQQALSDDGTVPASLRIAQRLSICLQAENARAVLKRLAGQEPEADNEEESPWGAAYCWGEWQQAGGPSLSLFVFCFCLSACV